MSLEYKLPFLSWNRFAQCLSIKALPCPISTDFLGGSPHPFPLFKMFHQSCHLGSTLSHEVMDGAQLDTKMCHPGNQTKTCMFKNVFEESTGWQGGGKGAGDVFQPMLYFPPSSHRHLPLFSSPEKEKKPIYIYFFFFFFGVGGNEEW